MRINATEFTGDIIKQIPILKRSQGNKGTKQKFCYKNVICAFDIETTRYKIGEKRISKTVIKDIERSIMYIWQFQIGKNITVFGRTWEEFIDFITEITNNINEDERLLIYVHNLSYEWNWLHDENILGKYINDDSVFILDSRKILRFLSNDDKLEFRCSYIHSNMSLDEFTSKMNVEHKKLSGVEYDYNKKRYPWTQLTEQELKYCENDVIGLVECIYKEMQIDEDTLYTIPLTSTGYVRREIKEAIKKLPYGYYESLTPNYEVYKMLREAFRGGNCHANRYFANKSLHKCEIYSADRSSSYPDVQMNCLFPVTNYFKPNKEVAKDTNHMFELINNGRGIIARIAFTGIKLHDSMFPVPYLSKDKCRYIQGNEEYPIIYDNGRIVQCAYLETTVTEIDLKIILSSYGGEYDIESIDVIEYYFCRLGSLPEEIKEVIREYYITKTKLKGLNDDLNSVLYMKSKNKLNSIYGNSAQDPGKVSIIYNRDFDNLYKEGYINRKTGEFKSLVLPENTEDVEKCKKINEEINELCYIDGNSTLPYQYGVYTTAYARYYLELAIRICGHNLIYTDTDSVYYAYDESINFDEYNKNRIESSTKNRAFADDSKGNRHYMGVMEQEHGDIKDTIITDFKTLGAKKYAWIDKKHGLNITISGVSKQKGKKELLRYCAERGTYYKPLNPIDVLGEGFVFNKAGGNEIEYIDKSTGKINIVDNGIEHELYIPSCAVIRDSTYKVSLTAEYKDLISYCDELLEEFCYDGSINYYPRILVSYPLDKIKGL